MSAAARPRRKAFAVAEQAAAASAAAELDEDEEWSDEESDDRGDEDGEDDEDDEAPPRKAPKKAAVAAGRARKKPAVAGAHRRPPGRTPAGMEWDAELGRWVEADPSSVVPAAAASTALVHVTEGSVPPVAEQDGPLEAAGADLPNWQVEYITKPNGRTATKFHGKRVNSLTLALSLTLTLTAHRSPLTFHPHPHPHPHPRAGRRRGKHPQPGAAGRQASARGAEAHR